MGVVWARIKVKGQIVCFFNNFARGFVRHVLTFYFRCTAKGPLSIEEVMWILLVITPFRVFLASFMTKREAILSLTFYMLEFLIGLWVFHGNTGVHTPPQTWGYDCGHSPQQRWWKGFLSNNKIDKWRQIITFIYTMKVGLNAWMDPSMRTKMAYTKGKVDKRSSSITVMDIIEALNQKPSS